MATITKNNPKINGLVLLQKDFLPPVILPAVIYLPNTMTSPTTEELVMPSLVDDEDSDDEDGIASSSSSSHKPIEGRVIPIIITPDEQIKKYKPAFGHFI